MKLQLTVTKWSGILLAVLGTLCLLFPHSVSPVAFWLAVTLFLVSGICLAIHLFRGFNLMTLAETVLCLGLGITLLIHHTWSDAFFGWVFFGYMAIIAFFLVVQVWLDACEHAWKAFVWDIALVGIYLGLGWLFHGPLLPYGLGAYLLVQGLQLILEVYDDVHAASIRTFVFRDWISLPVWFISFLPGIADNLIHKAYPKNPEKYDASKGGDVNFHVYIHGGLAGEALIGHMTFSLDGVMYSYGDYDRLAEKWFHTMGPGTLFTVNPEIYANNCCLYEHTDIFEFGLHLTEAQLEKLKQILESRLALTFPWECPLEKMPDPNVAFPDFESIYCNRLWYRTHCRFRQFHDSPWKWYFIVGMNCSLFAEDILSAIGCDIVHKRGIVSPGEYLDFFDALYAEPDSMVRSRSWHSKSDPATLFAVKQYGIYDN